MSTAGAHPAIRIRRQRLRHRRVPRSRAPQRPAPLLHRRQRRRRQIHPHRPPPLRLAQRLRRPHPRRNRQDHRPGATGPAIDFAQLTDGLRAEREQGITIDVAYRYFSTQRRKFIIADTPGHEQYTRNMATGASTADLAIILIDARKGILTQSRRHAYIASLLGIRHLVAAINKMDLVDFSEDVYRKIESDFRALSAASATHRPRHHPRQRSQRRQRRRTSINTPWYTGLTLLEHLETVPVGLEQAHQPFRLPVQRVIRPDQHYRGFAGQIAAGPIRKGDTIIALPSGRTSRVASITTFDGDLELAAAPQSIALTLEDELDISRGDIISEVAHPPQRATGIEASLVWFDATRLETHRPYLLKHGPQTLSARITRVLHRTNVETLQEEAVNSLGMNDIGVAEIEFTRPIFFDPYAENRATGNFILIDLHDQRHRRRRHDPPQPRHHQPPMHRTTKPHSSASTTPSKPTRSKTALLAETSR